MRKQVKFRQDIIRDTVSAIRSVRKRAKEAMLKGDNETYAKLMFDALYLEVGLPTDVEKYLAELDKNKKAA